MKKTFFGLMILCMLAGCTQVPLASSEELTIPQQALNAYLADCEVAGDEGSYTVTVVAPKFSELFCKGLVDSPDLGKEMLDELVNEHGIETVVYSFEVASKEDIRDGFFAAIANEIYCDTIASETFEWRLLQDEEDTH